MNTELMNIEEVKVEFTEAKYGWLSFTITVGDQKFEDRFSHVFDPLMNYKYWLESIAIGAQQTSFNYDNEGSEFKFDFEALTYKKCQFSIVDYNDAERVLLRARVDRLQLFKEFYQSLFRFYFSPSFNSKDWEIEFMSTRISELLSVEIVNLGPILLDLNRTQLINLIYLSDPYETSEIKYSNEISESNLDDLLRSLKGKRTYTEVVASNWSLSEKYDTWDKSKKIDFIDRCLEERTHGYSGTKILDCKSEIIENNI